LRFPYDMTVIHSEKRLIGYACFPPKLC